MSQHPTPGPATPSVTDWQTGTPVIPAGTMAHFWCRTKSGFKCLCYGNAFVMPLSDSLDEAPASAVPVGDDGDYAWTGWFEEACDSCDTYWGFDSENVLAWIKLPTP